MIKICYAEKKIELIIERKEYSNIIVYTFNIVELVSKFISQLLSFMLPYIPNINASAVYAKKYTKKSYSRKLTMCKVIPTFLMKEPAENKKFSCLCVWQHFYTGKERKRRKPQR